MTSKLTGLARKTDKSKAVEQAADWINEADTPARSHQGKGETRGRRLNVEIPEDLHRKLKHRAADEDCSVRELVIDALQQKLK
jgi:predicted HicB family RNase H-like nuclease